MKFLRPRRRASNLESQPARVEGIEIQSGVRRKIYNRCLNPRGLRGLKSHMAEPDDARYPSQPARVEGIEIGQGPKLREDAKSQPARVEGIEMIDNPPRT